jgi:hypothetical protein
MNVKISTRRRERVSKESMALAVARSERISAATALAFPKTTSSLLAQFARANNVRPILSRGQS